MSRMLSSVVVVVVVEVVVVASVVVVIVSAEITGAVLTSELVDGICSASTEDFSPVMQTLYSKLSRQ